MPRYFAFLRAINVGGRFVTMAALRDAFEALGLCGVETFIASGNVVFSTRSVSSAALESKIETGLRKALGYEVKTFLRTDRELSAIARLRPFPEPEMAAATAMNIGFVAQPLTVAGAAGLSALTSDIDEFHVSGREVYWKCLQRQSDSKFSSAVFERALKIAATWRSINTVQRLAAKYGIV